MPYIADLFSTKKSIAAKDFIIVVGGWAVVGLVVVWCVAHLCGGSQGGFLSRHCYVFMRFPCDSVQSGLPSTRLTGTGSAFVFTVGAGRCAQKGAL